jgi:hypothetical protein
MTCKYRLAFIASVSLIVGVFFGVIIVITSQNGLFPIENKAIPDESNGSTSQSDAVKDAFEIIEDQNTTYKGFELDQETRTVLISKSIAGSGRVSHFLWLIQQGSNKIWNPELVKAFTTYGEDIAFQQEDRDIVLVVKPQPSTDTYPVLEYYRYDRNGREKFAYLQQYLEGGANIRTQNGYISYTIKPVYSRPCSEFLSNTDKPPLAKLNGLLIGDNIYPITSSEVECLPSEGPTYAWFDPAFTFQEYDPDYSALTLILPDGRSILVDFIRKKIVSKKEKYSSPCFVDGVGASLIYTVPSSTTTLVEDVTKDQLFISEGVGKGTYNEVCLEFRDNRKDGDPIFDLMNNYGEGSSNAGTYEFDLKKRKFKKIR